MIRKVLVALALIFLPVTVVSAQVKPVQDDLHLLSSQESKDLTQFLLHHQKKIVVITRASDNVEDDALKFGRANGPDIVIWFTGKQIRVETGTYREGDLPDMLSDMIVRNHLQLIKDKKYYQFFKNVTTDIYQKIGSKETKTNVHSDDDNELAELLVELIVAHPWVLLLLVVGWIILFFICPDCALFFVAILFSGKSGGGSFSSSSGSFSGGGSTTDD
jgi:uncharacterized membrane protein YgcG